MTVPPIDPCESKVLAYVKGKRAVAKKRTEEMRLALDGAGVAPADDGQRLDVWAREVREWFRLEIAPHVLDGIALGRVGREREGARPDARKEVAEIGRAVRVGSIPHQRHRRAQMPRQLFAEGQHRGGIEVLLDEQLKIEPDDAAPRIDAEGGDHRDLAAMTANVPQHRRLSAPAPGAAHDGQQEQPTFVDEDQPCAQAVGFFLMRGQSCLIQRRIPSSSRSQARRVGRCGVQPSDRSNRPM